MVGDLLPPSFLVIIIYNDHYVEPVSIMVQVVADFVYIKKPDVTANIAEYQNKNLKKLTPVKKIEP